MGKGMRKRKPLPTMRLVTIFNLRTVASRGRVGYLHAASPKGLLGPFYSVLSPTSSLTEPERTLNNLLSKSVKTIKPGKSCMQ